MAFSQADIQAAATAQTAAATSQALQTRLVAGPGTGKSRTIEQRVGWLLSRGVNANAIAVVSFTRASAQDLRLRIQEYGAQNGIPQINDVRVRTLHSLGLRVLRRAGLLNRYPADPIVLDDWETEKIFDAEFSEVSNIASLRCEKIRRHNEAFWQTGTFNPPNFIPPQPPITDHEQQAFQAFHSIRTQLYSCVLPGEIIRQCIEATAAGTLYPNELLQLEHLIVDEFQDLNPLDQEFVGHFIEAQTHVFVAGDDDQSIYSFRFAAPQGIQDFLANYPGATGHVLQHCFRYGTSILNAGATLMANFPVPNRLPKNFISMYMNSTPPVPGDVYRWKYEHGSREANGIAATCDRLIGAGIEPREILILLNDSRALGPRIERALTEAEIPFDGIRKKTFKDADAGRFVLACLRIICAGDDYVALRVLLGELPQIGVGTCNQIAERAIANNLNYRSLFFGPLPNGVLGGRALTALNRARVICAQIGQWHPDETLAIRSAEMSALLLGIFGHEYQQEWDSFVQPLPNDTTLKDIRDLMSANTDEQIANVMRAIFERLELPTPEEGFMAPRVRIMTMHGAKGLSAKVVLIPGLEEEVFPGPRRRPYPGLVLEGARLLYVSITRARVACFLSFAKRRFINGQHKGHTASRYAAHTAGIFSDHTTGVSTQQANGIFAASQNL